MAYAGILVVLQALLLNVAFGQVIPCQGNNYADINANNFANANLPGGMYGQGVNTFTGLPNGAANEFMTSNVVGNNYGMSENGMPCGAGFGLQNFAGSEVMPNNALNFGVLSGNAVNAPLSLPMTLGNSPNNAVANLAPLPPNLINPNAFPSSCENFFSPIIQEIVPNLQFGEINLEGNLPVGGSIKVFGTFPVYGMIAVDGNVPSSGTAIIDTGMGIITQAIEPNCVNKM